MAINISDLTLNESNPRYISKDKMTQLIRSIRDFPKMMSLRPIIVDENNVILGGNMRYRALVELEYKEIPEEWVRKENTLTEEEKREFIIKDNVSFGFWEMDMLANEWDEVKLSEWGLDTVTWESPGEEDEETIYTKKIAAPIYEPKGEEPPIGDLYNERKYRELIEKIEGSDLPDDLRTFLKLAAGRHVVFNYSKIAEYYAHATKEIQELMEASALVIIDYERAIEEGFVQLTDYLINQREEENDEG